ncbi:ABC transporter substrate-binding protein [Pseudofrankia asymbiotica]|uniref:ABC transporter substrate-binding protein n=1 Tax=Pseudofrankia asymbiotica TaxID=1834516 RepID=A0A1V2IE36_9ACTN|nr:ABC transporter substrate-binding protein [Pseudofrankia asymbiotica]ONH31458.1 ABC transporter substrate-binding protein [Pseudofrankia asymbiotica]
MRQRTRWGTRLVPALLAVAGLLAAAACGGTTDDAKPVAATGAATPTADKPVTISFLSYNYGTPGIGGKGTQSLLDAFHKAHPNITVKPQGVKVADVLTRLRTDTAAGSPPDVAQIGWSKMAEAVRTLPVVPVQKAAPADEWSAHVAGLSPSIMKAVTQDGVVAAMPYTMSIPVMYINADLFKAAGLDPANPPKTLDDVRAAGLAIKKATGKEGAYVAVVDSGKSDYLTQSVIASAGGSLVGSDGSVTLDQKPAVDALTAVAGLTSSGAMPKVDTTAAVASFTKGEMGMLVGSTALLVSAQQAAAGHFTLTTAAFPQVKAGTPARPTYSGAGLAILAKDPDKQRAAWEFIKFLTSDAGFEIITSQIGYLPLRKTIETKLADTPTVKLLKPALDQLATVTPYTSFPSDHANEAVVTLQDDAVEPIVLRGADPAGTLSSVADKIRKLVG